MLTQLTIVDNFFDNPEEIIDIALKQNYYTYDCHPLGAKSGVFEGYRSDQLSVIEPELFKQVNQKFFEKTIKNTLTPNVAWACDCQFTSYFHYLTENSIYNDSWKHKDHEVILAGVIYLNENPAPNSGTSLWNSQGKHTIPNEFNKLVLYNASDVHSANGGFGKDLSDARLTITFFVTEIHLNIKANI